MCWLFVAVTHLIGENRGKREASLAVLIDIISQSDLEKRQQRGKSEAYFQLSADCPGIS